ncbi:MAG: LysR family transcriptional regulator [Burkholderiales bacterium]|nr:LysR family transcriptional regulator [Burkholderiales bacterium]
MSNALPSLRQLRYLVTLSETLNFRRAAESLYVTQSTLSAGIKELENVLGATLVERDKRNVRFTPLGYEVVKRARKMLAEAEDLVQLARGSQEPLSGLLRLGVIPTIAPFLLPMVLPVLREAHPRLQLYLREDLTERLIERVESGELDFALIALPYDTKDLMVRELFKDEFWFVTRQGDKFAREKEVAIRDIDPARVLLLEEGHCLRDHAIEACGTRRMAARQTKLEATSLFTLLQMVHNGMGVTLLPEMVIKAGALVGSQLIARPFSGRIPARTIALLMRRSSPLTVDFVMLGDLISTHHLETSRTRVATRSKR